MYIFIIYMYIIYMYIFTKTYIYVYFQQEV